MGESCLHNGEGCAVFRSAHGWQVLLFNHHHYANAEALWDAHADAEKMIGDGTARAFDLVLDGLPPRVQITRSLVDREHGCALPAWQEMGSPDWPTTTQLERLHQAAMPKVEAKVEPTNEGRLAVMETLAPLAMMLIEIEPV